MEEHIYIPQMWEKKREAETNKVELPLILSDDRGRPEIVIGHDGIHAKSLRANVPSGTGPELEIRQATRNIPNQLGSGIRVINIDNDKHCQMGWDNNNKFTIYSVDNNDPPTKQVCQFDRDKITGIADPTDETDVANKRYVDSIKPVITIWATAKRTLQTGVMGFHTGVNAIANKQAGYPMPVSGRIIHGSLGIHVNNIASLPQPDVDVVKVVINETPINYFISLGGTRSTYPVNAGDSITFVPVVDIPNINSATVSLLIELDL